MDKNVELFTGVTPLKFDADIMLDKAKNANLDQVMVAGYTKEGELFFCSNVGDGGTVLWLMESAKKRLLEMA